MNIPRNQRFHSWLPFYTLLQKEVRRFIRVASQTLVTPVITASLYLFIFGATLGERIQLLEGFSYAQFVIPGLILMGVINNSFSNVASSLFMSRYLGNIVDLLVTPVTPAQFILAYTLAAMIRGLAVGIIVWLISGLFATLPWAHPFAVVLMALLASFLFAQFGIIAAIHADNFDSLAMYTNFIILPLIYLGGVFYPISILPPFWAGLSHLNPLFYLIDGFRYALLGVGDLPFALSFGLAFALAVCLFGWAAHLINKSHRLRN
ncbi:MAG: ABC transporter permease [Deltaproteobacteria bacterium]|jgi:ABC-2 type transport system permease protein|nr:ABC transporter permease [Deltaproteobacteria bacterium]MBW2477541.1 ABC transporter permease [Deltaproteobacteria bacterium]MBW2504059.1 ABC transporter permease [Deltaproteobacteria bacterium]MBW2520371.1 ABC transporter permease [Deltaproteobacteria bacterium]